MIALPHVNIYLNKDENEKLKKLCQTENCSRYALAKSLVLEAMKSYEGKDDVRKTGLGEENWGDNQKGTGKVEAPNSSLPPFVTA